MTELKKCKKCGYPAEVIECFNGNYAVGCMGKATCPNNAYMIDKEFDTEEEAVKWWNNMQESE